MIDLVLDKIPVSISLGLWTTLLVYLISIPLGIRKAIPGRQPLRHLVVGRGDRRLRDPELPVRRAC